MGAAEILTLLGIVVGVVIYVRQEHVSKDPTRRAAQTFCEQLRLEFLRQAQAFCPFVHNPQAAYREIRHKMGKLLPIVWYGGPQFELWLLHPTKCGETVIRFWIGDEYTDILTLKADGSVFEKRRLDYQGWINLKNTLTKCANNNSVPFRVFAP